MVAGDDIDGMSDRVCVCLLAVPIIRRARKIAKIEYKLRHVCPYVCHSAWNNSVPTGRILLKFDIRGFFENLSRKFRLH